MARGDVVTVELPNWWETSVVIHAVLRIGGVPNPVVPIYRDREMSFIIAQARPRVVVVPHRFRQYDYVAMLQRIVDVDGDDGPVVLAVRPEGELPAGVVDFGSLLVEDGQDSHGAELGDACAATDIALLLYTSGTTADPKGVLHDHSTLEHENRSIIELFSLDRGSTRVHGFARHAHHRLPVRRAAPPDARRARRVVGHLGCGRARELIDAEECRFTVGATPFLQGLTDEYSRNAGPCPLSAFACGGADVPPDLVRRSRAVLHAAVVRVYGSSEFPTVTCSSPDDGEHLAADTDGRPIGAEVECRIDRPDERGVGELVARGPELFLGYLDASLNDDAFTDDGWFRTGDLASIDHDGAVTIRGRSKDIIVRGGENISAKEVEDLLYTHPSIREVAIVAMPDPVMVERACAFVVTEPAATLQLDDIVAFLDGHRLARQKFPEHLVLVDELPKTPSGKVQKFILRDRLTRPASEE